MDRHGKGHRANFEGWLSRRSEAYFVESQLGGHHFSEQKGISMEMYHSHKQRNSWGASTTDRNGSWKVRHISGHHKQVIRSFKSKWMKQFLKSPSLKWHIYTKESKKTMKCQSFTKEILNDKV